jgi:threonine/homoserine/homoserine lactone efflux protein
MAVQALHEQGLLQANPERSPLSHAAIVRRGFLINILNPKLSLFFLAFLPQFVPTDTARPAMAMIWLGIIFMVMTLVIFICYGQMAGLIRDRVLASGTALRWMRRSFAAAFALVGLRLAFSQR